MYTRQIEYINYNGEKRKDDFCFNLNAAEITEWLTTEGDYTLDKVMLRITKERNGRKIMETFKDLIYRSYGVPTLDGNRFVKSKEVKEAFMESEAYSALFMELVTDARKAAEFFINIIPKEMSAEISDTFKNNPDGIPDELKDYMPQLANSNKA